MLSAVGLDPYDSLNYHRSKPLSLEDAYQKLEFLYYDKKFSLDQIFGYSEKIVDSIVGDIYGDWFDYIDKYIELVGMMLCRIIFIINIILLER